MSEARSEVPRVLVFGTTGQGKSSLINLLGDLTGNCAATVGHSAQGETFASKEYRISDPDGVEYILVDTAGLNEAKTGARVKPADAADNLFKLLASSRNEGFCLAIFVLRSDKFEEAFQDNYKAFVEGFLDASGVPVILVKTGLDLKSLSSWHNPTTKGLLKKDYTLIKDVAGGTCGIPQDMDPDFAEELEKLNKKMRAKTYIDVWSAIYRNKSPKNQKLPIGKYEVTFKNMWNGFVGFMQRVLPGDNIWDNLKWVGDTVLVPFRAIYKSPEKAKEKAAEFLRYLKE